MTCPHNYENADYCPDCSAGRDADWLRAELLEARAEVKRLQALVESLTAQVAAQRDLLLRKARR